MRSVQSSPHGDYLHVQLMLKAGIRASKALSVARVLGFSGGRLMVQKRRSAKDRTLWIGDEMLSKHQEWVERRPNLDRMLPIRKCKWRRPASVGR